MFVLMIYPYTDGIARATSSLMHELRAAVFAKVLQRGINEVCVYKKYSRIRL